VSKFHLTDTSPDAQRPQWQARKLVDRTSGLSSQDPRRIAIKNLMHYIQACATAHDKTYVWRSLREFDKSSEPMRLAPVPLTN